MELSLFNTGKLKTNEEAIKREYSFLLCEKQTNSKLVVKSEVNKKIIKKISIN